MPSPSSQETDRWNNTVDFCRKHFSEDSHLEEQHSFRELWQLCGSFGLPGLLVAEEYGGSAASASEAALSLEAAGYSCRNNGLLAALSAHILACTVPISKFGNAWQKRRWLPDLCNGEWIGAHAATEPEAGSDFFHLETQAQAQGDKYILNGRKIYVLNAPVADLVLVFARIVSGTEQESIASFIVEKNTPGMSVARTIEMAGLPGASMGEIVFENCIVPTEHRLGTSSPGMMTFHIAMHWERTLILASHVGTMKRVLEKCIDYARKRQQFGQNIGKFQSVSNRIADMRLRLHTSRLLLYDTARMLDARMYELDASAMTKLYISEAAVSTYLEAVRIHGASGYTHEKEFAQDLQDALGTLILSGTSDIQRQIISRALGVQ